MSQERELVIQSIDELKYVLNVHLIQRRLGEVRTILSGTGPGMPGEKQAEFEQEEQGLLARLADIRAKAPAGLFDQSQRHCVVARITP